MQTLLVNMTPKLAAKYLQKNTCNRPIRRTFVEGIKAALLRGEYVTSHQGIAFTEDGVFADGQHRLTAISELDSGVFPMLVTTGLPKAAFKVMDIGSKRTASEALGDDRRTVEVASCFATICDTSKRASQSPAMLIPYIERIRPIHNDLMAYCASSSKTWSAVAIRAAAVLSVILGADADYVKSVYRALVLTDLDAMPPIAKALFKSQLSGVVNVRDKVDTIARCLAVFDKKRANNKMIKVFDTQRTYQLVRETFADIS